MGTLYFMLSFPVNLKMLQKLKSRTPDLSFPSGNPGEPEQPCPECITNKDISFGPSFSGTAICLDTAEIMCLWQALSQGTSSSIGSSIDRQQNEQRLESRQRLFSGFQNESGVLPLTEAAHSGRLSPPPHPPKGSFRVAASGGPFVRRQLFGHDRSHCRWPTAACCEYKCPPPPTARGRQGWVFKTHPSRVRVSIPCPSKGWKRELLTRLTRKINLAEPISSLPCLLQSEV